jgi:outer membrane exchange protein TraA
MPLLRRFQVLLPVVLAMGAGLPSVAEPLPSVVINGEPVAPSPTQPGAGLCSASSVWTRSLSELPQSRAFFNSQLNAYLDENAGSRQTSVLRTRFDLSNNHFGSGPRWSDGDFTGSVLGCPSGGCPFVYNDPTTAFVTRLRGLLDITNDRVGKPLHFGFFADDAVSLTLFDRSGARYEVINRPPMLGAPVWRTTNSVTFEKPGLYPIEILYAQVAEYAVLELSMFEGTFADFERAATQTPIVSLADEGFLIVAPEMFHQSESGQPSFSDPERCAQCDRRGADTTGNGGCGAGYHCNAAALCSACDSERFCGDACLSCGAGTPFCVSQTKGYACVECRGDADCPAPDACHVGVCDATGTCSFPAAEDGTACPGGTCQAGLCLPPDAGSADAGSPDGSGPDGGGGGLDGGAGSDDGGVGPDGGAEGPDASTPDAATPDGSTPGADGGVSEGEPDAGGSSDAGTEPDAGGNSDAGSEPDAGGSSDAGTEPGSDGGSAGGDGPPTGCGCGTGVPPLAPLSLLGLVLLVRRVRRARSG